MNIEKSVWAVATYLINFINFNAIIVSAHIVLLHKIQDLGCTVLLIICLKQENLYNLFIICLASYSYAIASLSRNIYQVLTRYSPSSSNGLTCTVLYTVDNSH